jgi:general secretion pathway protein I
MRFASTGSPVASLWSAYRSSGRARPRPHAGSRGFTLIEALAAIVILALALSALLSAHDTGLRGAAVIDDHLQARLLAQSVLAQRSLERTPQAPAQGRSGRFAWTVSVAPYAGAVGTLDPKSAQWMLHEVTVTVAWPPRRQVQLSTLRLMSVR